MEACAITRTTTVHALMLDGGAEVRAALARNCRKQSINECFISDFVQTLVNYKICNNSEDKTIQWLNLTKEDG